MGELIKNTRFLLDIYLSLVHMSTFSVASFSVTIFIC